MKSLPLILLSALLALTACGEGEVTITETEESFEENQEALTSPGKFETFVGKDGQHYFNLFAANGERVLVSEGYASLSGAKSGIASVKNNGQSATRYLLRETVDGAWYFVLTSTNGQIIGVSEMYVSKYNANRAINSVVNVVKATVAATPAPALAGNAKFEVFKGLDSKWYFHLRAGNGEIVLQSQGYTTKAGATNGTSSVHTNGANPARYEVLGAADGKTYFRLKAANGQIIARAQTYETKYNAERGVDTCVSILSGGVDR